ncbi:hypothetical protein [Cellvibrio sp. pealriver]|uniref:hypothetical protein n=1 Tax=Cellvibrio sp. pealriver TaxID=1622269 RepID=UPI00066FDE5E|nr:hypothetical protein [Cellvibrio sp. pealriver]
MKSTHYLAIAVRLFSVILFLYGVKNSSFIFSLIFDLGNQIPISTWSFAIASTVLPVVAASFLWMFPMLIANALIKPEMDQLVEPISVKSALAVLVSVIGLFFLFNGIIDSVYWMTLWKLANSHDSGVVGNFHFGSENISSMVATGVELLLSAFLILKSRACAYHMLRFAS